MEDLNDDDIESQLDKKCSDIKGETSIDNVVGIYIDRDKVLFDRMLQEKEKMATVKHNVKWFNSEAKQTSHHV